MISTGVLDGASPGPTGVSQPETPPQRAATFGEVLSRRLTAYGRWASAPVDESRSSSGGSPRETPVQLADYRRHLDFLATNALEVRAGEALVPEPMEQDVLTPQPILRAERKARARSEKTERKARARSEKTERAERKAQARSEKAARAERGTTGG